jgi:hypothetical protein
MAHPPYVPPAYAGDASREYVLVVSDEEAAQLLALIEQDPAAKQALQFIQKRKDEKASISETFTMVEKLHRLLRSANYTEGTRSVEQENQLGLIKRIPSRMFDTAAHRSMVSTIITRARTLAMDGYDGMEGNVSSCMIGARGIGKTCMLRCLAVLLRLVFPSLIPVYVTYLGARGRSPAAMTSIQEILGTVLQRCGVPRDTPAYFEEDLRRNGKQLLLLVDELDVAYTVQGANADHIVHSLAVLQELGSSSTGRVMAILAGSSAAIPTLIKRNLNDRLEKEFPIVTQAPNLNGSKYHVWSVSVNQVNPFDLDAVASILHLPPVNTCAPWELARLRLIAFIAGSNARRVGRVDQEEVTAAALEPPEADTGSNIMRDEFYQSVFEALLTRMCIKNRDLMVKLAPQGMVNPTQVMNCDWEKTFQPLTSKEVDTLWASIKVQYPAEEKADQQTCLEWISDRSWIQLGVHQAGKYLHIWPRELFQLFRHRQLSRLEAAVETAAETQSGSLSLAAGAVQVSALTGVNVSDLVDTLNKIRKGISS